MTANNFTKEEQEVLQGLKKESPELYEEALKNLSARQKENEKFNDFSNQEKEILKGLKKENPELFEQAYNKLRNKYDSESLKGRAKQVWHGAKKGIADLAEIYQGKENQDLSIDEMTSDEHKEKREAIKNKQKEYQEPLYDDALGRYLHKAGEFGVGAATGNIGSNAPIRAASLAGKLVSKPIKEIARSNVGRGATQGVLTQGIEDATDLGEGASSLIAGLAPSAIKGALGHRGLSHRARGLGPKNIDTDLYDAAKELGVDAPNFIFSNGRIQTSLAKHSGKIPFVSKAVNKKIEAMHDQMLEKKNAISESVGPYPTKDYKEKTRKLYEDSMELAPNAELIDPKNLQQKLKEERKLVKGNIDDADAVKTVNKYINQIAKKTEQDKLLAPKHLANDKKYHHGKRDAGDATNQTMHRTISRLIGEEIEDYGKTTKSPEGKAWYKADKAARKHSEAGHKRLDFEEALGDVDQPGTDILNYKKIYKQVKNPGSELHNIKLDKVLKNKLEDFAALSHGIAKKQKSIKLPALHGKDDSKLDLTVKSLAILGKIALGYSTKGLGFVIPASLSAPIRNALTNKKFLDAAVKFARNPTKSLAQRLDFMGRQQLGTGMVGLRNALQAYDQED